MRQLTMPVTVGSVVVGGGQPVVVQSMTNTDTADALRTVAQIAELYQAGSEIVRVTVNNEESAAEVPYIVEKLQQMNIPVPLVGDFHYNGHKLLTKYPACAEALAKYRINPGNVGLGSKKDDNFAQMIEIACKNQKPVRIGVNWGSLDQSVLARLLDENQKVAEPKSLAAVTREAVIVSALESAAQAMRLGLSENQIILSCKMSRVPDLIAVYRELAARCRFALHLGLTEAGMGSKGIVASTAALAVLLQEGIGDTIRISLTPEPGQSRCEEVRVAQEILQSLELRAFTPQVTACPGCGRTTSVFFQELAQEIQNFLREQMPLWRSQYPGVENLKVAVMGCVVNGPGESKHADIGISLPGSGEQPVAPVYVDGERVLTLKGESIAAEFRALVMDYVAKRYASALK